MSYVRPALALLVALGGAACGSRDADEGSSGLVVAAAAGLAIALPELIRAFEHESGIRVTATLGSTGQLAQQIEAGAPVDVFLAADREWVDRLEAAGRVLSDTRRVYAHGVLVLYSRDASIVDAGLEGLRASAAARIAIANPMHAPYGRAARQALESLGLLAELERRIVFAENARQTLQWAETRNVDAAIAPLALMVEGQGHWIELSASLHAPIEQTLAIVVTTSRADAARRFAAFVTGSSGRAILARHRFTLPEADARR